MNTEDMFKSLKKYSLEKPYLNTEMGQYAFQLGFEEGDKCANKTMIEKACEILDSMLYMYDGLETDIVTSRCDTVEDFINEFKKLMAE